MSLIKKLLSFLGIKGSKDNKIFKPGFGASNRSEENNETSKGKSILFVSLILFSGAVILCTYSLSLGVDRFLSVISIATMIAFSSAIVGAFIGFIFGIPRTPASKDPDNIAANTNLEEISDWITKIIVGVSLVQLNQISGGIIELGHTLSKALGDTPTSFVFAISTLIFYFVGGFFLGYLWSRIYLPKILRASLEEGRLRQELSETKTELIETKSKQDLQADIRLEVDKIMQQSDPKNFQEFDTEIFSQDNLQKLIDNIIITFNKKESSTLFGQIIASLYKVGYYDVMNNLADIYKSKLDINYINWTDIALANLNLYNTKPDLIYKERLREAVSNVRKVIADYGVPYAIELYFGTIDLRVSEIEKDNQLAEQAKASISKIWGEIKKKPEVTAYETLNYLNLNEGKSVWTDYNKTIRELYPDDYKEIYNRSEKYKSAHPEITQNIGAKS
jgi:hypothetical protein